MRGRGYRSRHPHGGCLMSEGIETPVSSGCPRCGWQIEVPEDCADETIVTCDNCGFSARWADFSKAKED
jgi:predicted RNA-binding Zn-ribbon protein involved in translation (DUF1610 family)